jgi:hypothetical protein
MRLLDTPSSPCSESFYGTLARSLVSMENLSELHVEFCDGTDSIFGVQERIPESLSLTAVDPDT